MKKLVQILLLSSALVGVASADTVFVDGKAVDQKVIDQAMAQLKKNPMAAQTDIMDSIPLIYGFGQQNIYIGNPLNDIEIYNGKYNSMTIQICDQNGNSLALLDSNVVLSFIIRNRNLHEVRDV